MAHNRLITVLGHLSETQNTNACPLEPSNQGSSLRPVRVCVTGAAGQIASNLLPLLLTGEAFGPNRPVVLHLLEIEPAFKALQGLVMELEDSSWPLLHSVVPTTDPTVAFKDVDWAILVGAFPRKQGMERKDLLSKNANIFIEQGKALDTVANKNVRVVVVGNPANTNCMILARHAPSIPKQNFTALTRLDQNRAKSMLGSKLNVPPSRIANVTIWGNHSKTQYPDAAEATAWTTQSTGFRSIRVKDALPKEFLRGEFITKVQDRGAAVIAARGQSSTLSAACAIKDHVRDWVFGTKEGEWVSMGVYVEDQDSGTPYGVPSGIVYSFPLVIRDGKWKIVRGLDRDDFDRKQMEITAKELLEERDEAAQYFKN
eukprot:TRINITY_DN11757_c0_g1_i1.p1 TRINITY_DN11757_c0_g1~~TRINITY_DN11757_c0_g1_i1.p1  ORF type:complete len:372 (-),score=55.96 TRINITY_DN11757_c0_g1_i1:24-1139(-)